MEQDSAHTEVRLNGLKDVHRMSQARRPFANSASPRPPAVLRENTQCATVSERGAPRDGELRSFRLPVDCCVYTAPPPPPLVLIGSMITAWLDVKLPGWDFTAEHRAVKL